MTRERILLIVALIISVVALLTPLVVLAADSGSSSMAVVITDGKGIRGSTNSKNMTMSVVGIVANLRADQRFAYINAEQPSVILGPVGGSGQEFAGLQTEIENQFAVAPAPGENSLYNSLASAHSVLSLESAAPGSTVYVVFGETPGQNLESLLTRISPLLSDFAQDGWIVSTLVPASASTEIVKFSQNVTGATNGQRFLLSVPGGLKTLSASILGNSAIGSLQPLAERIMDPNFVLSSSMDVAPGTSETTLVFFKDDPQGTLRLTDPDGVEAIAGLANHFHAANTAHFVIWRLVDPKPGRWRIDASGLTGAFEVGHYSSNRYTLEVASPTTVPVGEPNTLVVYVSEGHGPVMLDDVRVVAHVALRDGNTIAYTMSDTGIAGDSVAGDGYYSVLLPPAELEGEYALELSLIWRKFQHEISTQEMFVARGFPSIEVRPVSVGDIKSGERTQIATLFIHINGEPYPIELTQLSAHVGSSGSSDASVEFLAQSSTQSGTSSVFDVYTVLQGEGLHNLTFQLDVDYAGRAYAQLSESMVVASLEPPEPIVELVFTPEELSFFDSLLIPKWAIIFVPSLIVFLLLGSLLSWLLRTEPRGYLYNDRGEMVADFSKVKRHPLRSFVFRSTILGQELKIPGFESVRFGFRGRRVNVRNKGPQSSVRVNDEPLARAANLYNKSWIGARGRLYSFLFSKPNLQAAAIGTDGS